MKGAAMRRRVLAAWLLPALLAGCAPPTPRGLETLEVATRTQAQAREQRLRVCEASAVLRVESRATGRLPAVSVTAVLAEPGRVRLQARWLLGVLLDASLTGDTLTAWMPAERLGLRVPRLGDTLGVADPAVFLRRALAAGWQPPREAWRNATTDSAGAALHWQEDGRDWDMRVDRAGRPREVGVSEGGDRLSVRYPEWQGAGADALPTRLEIVEREAQVRVRVELEDLRPLARAKPEWFALSLPAGLEPFGFDDLRRVLAGREPAR
jgi:hypothetical protein